MAASGSWCDLQCARTGIFKPRQLALVCIALASAHAPFVCSVPFSCCDAGAGARGGGFPRYIIIAAVSRFSTEHLDKPFFYEEHNFEFKIDFSIGKTISFVLFDSTRTVSIYRIISQFCKAS
jgi:hypothetical protein